MLPERRRQIIEEQLLRVKEVRISDLAQRFEVSEMTIRRDLDVMEEQRRLRKVRGGAVPWDPPASVRSTLNVEAKQSIGAAVAPRIPAGSVVGLGAGTTVAAVAARLTAQPLTVVSVSLSVVQLLGPRPETHLHLVGGRYRHATESLTGSVAVSQLHQFRVDLAVVGASGIDAEGVYNHHPEDAALQQVFLEIAAETWLVVDSSKLGRRATARIAPCQAFDRIFTDSHAPPQLVAELTKLTEVETVESPTTEASAS